MRRLLEMTSRRVKFTESDDRARPVIAEVPAAEMDAIARELGIEHNGSAVIGRLAEDYQTSKAGTAIARYNGSEGEVHVMALDALEPGEQLDTGLGGTFTVPGEEAEALTEGTLRITIDRLGSRATRDFDRHNDGDLNIALDWLVAAFGR